MAKFDMGEVVRRMLRNRLRSGGGLPKNEHFRVVFETGERPVVRYRGGIESLVFVTQELDAQEVEERLKGVPKNEVVGPYRGEFLDNTKKVYHDGGLVSRAIRDMLAAEACGFHESAGVPQPESKEELRDAAVVERPWVVAKRNLLDASDLLKETANRVDDLERLLSEIFATIKLPQNQTAFVRRLTHEHLPRWKKTANL